MGKSKGGGKKGSNRLPIFAAADDDDVDAVREILREHPTARDAKNSDGWVPLMQAAFSGSTDVCKVLIEEYQAPVGAVCKQGDTALHYAVVQGYHDIVEYLASKGAPLELKDKDGETPMDVAGKDKAMKKLLERLIKEREEAGDQEDGKKEEEMDDDEWEEA